MRLKRIGVLGLMLALVALGVIGPAGPAGAARNYICTASGEISITTVDETSYQWNLQGSGSCLGGVQGVLTVDFTGAGDSLTLGICSGHLFVQELDLAMTMNYLNHATHVVTTKTEHWVAPLTTYPTATPFLIERAPGETNGVGVLLDHIFALLDQSKCPPGGGVTSTTYAWAEQSAKSF